MNPNRSLILSVGTRVMTNIGIAGTIIKDHRYLDRSREVFAYTIKLDKKAPNEYAWNTDEILQFPNDLEEL